MARSRFAEPLSIYVAKGFGRSYGQESGCLGKKFPGIFFSGLWHALPNDQSAATHAFLTDIGNDLGYEVPVETILEWITGCLDRLQEREATVVLTDVPLMALESVSETQFRLFRALLFPQCRLRRQELLTRACSLSEALQRLAESREMPIFSLPKCWYGLDPIHPRKRFLRTYWQSLISFVCKDNSSSSTAHETWLWRAYLHLLRAEKWSLCSVARSATQPNGRLRDGTTIALY